MPRVRLYLPMFVALILALSLVAAAQDQKNADEEKAVRAVAEQYSAAYASKDAEKLMSFWSTKSPGFESRKREIQKLFLAGGAVDLRNLELSKLKVNRTTAIVRVSVDASSVDAKTGKPAEGFGKWRKTLRLTAETGSWKVWSELDPEEDLAVALVAAKTEEERAKLMEPEKELLTRELTEALIWQGGELAKQGELPRALEVYRLALSVAERIDDKAGVAGAFYWIGRVLKEQGDSAQALQYYEKSLALSEASGDKEKVARTLSDIGLSYAVQGKTDQALGFFERSLVLATELGDKQLMARTAGNMGTAYSMQGKYALAMQHQRKALAEHEALGSKLDISICLNEIANLEAILGNLPDALDYYKKSLALSESIGDQEGVGLALSNIGNIYHARGDNAQALGYYQKSLAEGGGFEPLVNLGVLYDGQGDYAQALSYYLKALATLEADKQESEERAFALKAIADIYRSQGNHSQALDYYQKALAMSEASGHKPRTAQVLNGIGKNYFLQHSYSEALDYYLKSLKVVEETGTIESLPGLLVDIAKVHLAQERYSQALEFGVRSADVAKRSGQVDGLWKALTVAGQTYRALNQPEKARSSHEEAIASIEAARLQVAGGEEQQQRFMEGKILPYQEMIELLVATGKAGEALAFAERSKGRVLLDVLQSGKINVSKSMTAQESQEEKKFNNELVSLNAQISMESQQPQPNQRGLADLRARLERTRLDHEAFRTGLYAAHPNLKAQRGEAPAISLKDAFDLLPDGKSALLEYVVAQARTYVFVLTKNDVPKRSQPTLKVYPIEIKQKELGERVARYREKMAKGDLDFRAEGRELFDLLLKPAQDQLRGKTLLVLVPDGVLWDLPFQALQSSAQHYVIEEQAISYAPSLTVLKEVATSRRRLPRNSEPSATLLAFGNPTVAKQTEQRVKAVFMDENLDPLPEAEKQVTALAELYGAKQSRVYTRAEAREDRAKSEAPAFRIIQFATHGILNSTSPMYSHLVLSQAVGDPNEDGLLEAWEVMDLNLTADMVVLAACETARGRMGAGEGMIGMSWAFFVAGSPTTVASQWKVESASTTQLMLEFHRNLKSRIQNPNAQISKARALQLASLKLLKSREYQHPFYWAGFVLIGDAF